MIFNNATDYQELPKSLSDLKKYLNYNPVHNRYTAKQNIPERSPNETDRGGWRGYDRVYSRFFKDIQNDKICLLEIGIMHGYGILAWQRFFKNAIVYGVDLFPNDQMLLEFENIKQDFSVFKKSRMLFFDTTKTEDWFNLYGKKFDVIIDDGGHHPHTQIDTFKNAWKHLKPGGLYFIEDVSHRYGDDELQSLSDLLENNMSDFELIEIYYHINHGLKKVYMDDRFLQKNRIKHRDNLKEYIVVLKKKLE